MVVCGGGGPCLGGSATTTTIRDTLEWHMGGQQTNPKCRHVEFVPCATHPVHLVHEFESDAWQSPSAAAPPMLACGQLLHGVGVVAWVLGSFPHNRDDSQR